MKERFINVVADGIEGLGRKVYTKLRAGYVIVGAQKSGNRYFLELELLGGTPPSQTIFHEIEGDWETFKNGYIIHMDAGTWKLCGIDRQGSKYWALLIMK